VEVLPAVEVVVVNPDSRVAIVAIPAEVVFRFPPVVAAVTDNLRRRPLIAAPAESWGVVVAAACTLRLHGVLRLRRPLSLIVVVVITISRGGTQRSDGRHGKKKTSKSESLQHGFRASLSFEVGFFIPTSTHKTRGVGRRTQRYVSIANGVARRYLQWVRFPSMRHVSNVAFSGSFNRSVQPLPDLVNNE
jgi:hypothetical protein